MNIRRTSTQSAVSLRTKSEVLKKLSGGPLTAHNKNQHQVGKGNLMARMSNRDFMIKATGLWLLAVSTTSLHHALAVRVNNVDTPSKDDIVIYGKNKVEVTDSPDQRTMLEVTVVGDGDEKPVKGANVYIESQSPGEVVSVFESDENGHVTIPDFYGQRVLVVKDPTNIRFLQKISIRQGKLNRMTVMLPYNVFVTATPPLGDKDYLYNVYANRLRKGATTKTDSLGWYEGELSGGLLRVRVPAGRYVIMAQPYKKAKPTEFANNYCSPVLELKACQTLKVQLKKTNEK